MTDSPDALPEKPRSRRWYVVLTWITLIGFGLFVAFVTVGAIAIPKIRQERR